MLQNGADMIVGVVAVGLTVLGHDVQRVDLACPALADGVRDAADKEIRNDARIEAPRPDHDDIGVADGLHALRQGRRTLRDQPDLADAGIVDLFRVEDLALTEHAAAVVKLRLQPHILIGHGSTRPVMARTSPIRWTASSNEPEMPFMAARNRLPKLCPAREPSVKR